MPANESFIQGATDGAGKLVDTVTVTNPATSAVQHRQVVAIGDPSAPNNIAGVTSGGDQQVRNFTLEDLMLQIVIELRVMNSILQSTLNSRDDLDALRAAEALTTQQTTQ